LAIQAFGLTKRFSKQRGFRAIVRHPFSREEHVTGALEMMGYSLAELVPDIAIRSMFCLVLLPLSPICFRHAVHKAKVEGSLTHY